MDTCCGILHVKYLVEFDLKCAFWDQAAVLKDWESSISHSVISWSLAIHGVADYYRNPEEV